MKRLIARTTPQIGYGTWFVAFLLLRLSVPCTTVALVEGIGRRELTIDSGRWEPRPTWLPNPAPRPSLQDDRDGVVFRVAEPLKGMKWFLDMEPIDLLETPWLVVRYRAENLVTDGEDYFLYADDAKPGRQLSPLRLRDVTADGGWRLVAVDVGRMTDAEAVSAMAVQVQADQRGAAVLGIDRLVWRANPPPEAEILRQPEPDARLPDWSAPLAEADWRPQPDWLANPAAADRCHVQWEAERNVFRVETAGGGMKWHWRLPQPVALAGRRYLVLRYRARGAAPKGGYALSVLGTPAAEGEPGYKAAIGASELVADGRWRTLHVDTGRLAARYGQIDGLAVQLQAGKADATLEISGLELTNTERPSSLADALDWRRGVAMEGFTPVALDEVANSPKAPWLRHFRLSDWFDAAAVSVDEVPFTVRAEEPSLAATPLREKATLRIRAAGRATEVYLLLLAALSGPEEPAYGGGRLRSIRDVDRFRIRLEYASGPPDECQPMNLSAGGFGIVSGPQLLVATADADRSLQAVVLLDRCRQAAFAVAGLTLRTDGRRGFPEALEETENPLRLPERETAGRQPATELEVEWAPSGPPRLKRMTHRPSGWELLDEQQPLVGLWVDGKPVPPEDFERLEPDEQPPGRRDDTVWFGVKGFAGLTLGLDISHCRDEGLRVATEVRNAGPAEYTVKLVAPTIGPYRLASEAAASLYLVPRRGAVLDSAARTFRERYCGLFPVQFVDTFAPSVGRGLTLRTEDRECRRKKYLLEKRDGWFSIGVEYPARRLAPGESLATAAAVVEATDGDWRRGFNNYRRWLRQWYEPARPRQDWFRTIFNFRQRHLWGLDPLYDAATGRFLTDEALAEARRDFGGVDYLHLFDWGNLPGKGRVYGRDGDLDPFVGFAGGREALAEAIRSVREEGVPVGLYIEGYLLEEQGQLGSVVGSRWQLIDSEGERRYWPGSSEMFICPALPRWEAIQASTFARTARLLAADGMYIDQFGFAGADKDCHAPDHGHEVPSYAVTAERRVTRAVRNAMVEAGSSAVLYSEETPVDVVTQYQDGSFTYAMHAAQRTSTMVPLNIARFAFPDFKTIEILFCDQPTGSWATGVRWVFFNGEGLWLQGPAQQWFEPETLAEIRRCYAILAAHRDAFTTLEPDPLVETELSGVFANRFPTEGKTVYTLLNTRHRTVRGPILRLPHDPAAAYYDAWHDRPAQVVRRGGWDVVSTELGPHGAGCIVVERVDSSAPVRHGN